jgi:hypothetical protein
MTTFEFYFQKFMFQFFLGLMFFSLNMYVKQLFSWTFHHLNFISLSIITQCPFNIDFALLLPF